MRGVVLAAALLCAGPAAAQSRPAIDVNIQGSANPAAVTPKPCNLFDLARGVPQSICEARAVAAHRKAVGDLLASGDCPAALKLALETGDLGYAAQVRDYCATAAKPKPQ